jgi:ubiquinone/menaquinone biosynthesis C-methylase UbiE
MVSFGQWESWRRIVIDHVDGGTVLELGTGNGALQGPLRAQASSVLGLELSPQMLKTAKDNSLGHDHKQALVRADGCCLPFQSASVDVIVATFPEQYIATVVCLGECRRVLKDNEGAKVVIVGRWLELNRSIFTWLSPVFYRPLDRDEVDHFAENARLAGLEMQLQVKRMGWVTHHVIVLN